MTPAPASPISPLTNEAMEKSFNEALGLWESGMRIWLGYVTDCCSAYTPQAWFEANARLVASCLQAPGLAVGEIQRDTGLTAPTLVDA